jgi:hypothetical protein
MLMGDTGIEPVVLPRRGCSGRPCGALTINALSWPMVQVRATTVVPVHPGVDWPADRGAGGVHRAHVVLWRRLVEEGRAGLEDRCASRRREPRSPTRFEMRFDGHADAATGRVGHHPLVKPAARRLARPAEYAINRKIG